MPVYSMTGYACWQPSSNPLSTAENVADFPVSGEDGSPTWRFVYELRSVNSRFLDITTKLPDSLRQHERALREVLQKSLRRGKLELRIALEQPEDNDDALQAPSIPTLQKISAVQEHILGWIPTATPLSVADILHLPAARRHSPHVPDEAACQQALLEGLDKAINALMAARAAEGQHLAHSLQERIAKMHALAQQAEASIPLIVQQQQQRFLQRWQQALDAAHTAQPESAAAISAEAARERALTEATAFALRIDVAEEITRLRSHLRTMESLLDKGGELGKRLEFLIQELLREANTLGSKSAALETTQISLDMKVLIEQMREQVQNIE